MLLHEYNDFKDLVEAIAFEKKLLPDIVEKDYWVMHVLWRLQKLGFKYYLKGGTSLSKGYGLIDRFSEDLDLLIEPPSEMIVASGPNQNSKVQIESRSKFFNWISARLRSDGLQLAEVTCDEKYHECAIRLNYNSLFQVSNILKPGILLEIGFDQVKPFDLKDITSWSYDRAKTTNLELQDNRALAVPGSSR